jgi:hypothetical protein
LNKVYDQGNSGWQAGEEKIQGIDAVLCSRFGRSFEL